MFSANLVEIGLPEQGTFLLRQTWRTTTNTSILKSSINHGHRRTICQSHSSSIYLQGNLLAMEAFVSGPLYTKLRHHVSPAFMMQNTAAFTKNDTRMAAIWKEYGGLQPAASVSKSMIDCIHSYTKKCIIAGGLVGSVTCQCPMTDVFPDPMPPLGDVHVSVPRIAHCSSYHHHQVHQ